jgi:cell division septal protein FtsQ
VFSRVSLRVVIKRILIGVCVVSVSIGTLLLPFFKVTHITVSGTQLLPASLIKAATSQWEGLSFFSLYFRPHYQQNLKKQFPEIEHCAIQFIFPNTLQCHITEKAPWVTLLIEGKSVLISEDGTILSHYQLTHQLVPLDFEKMLIIRGISQNEFNNTHQNSLWLTDIRPLVTLIQTELSPYVIQLEKNKNNEWILLKDDTFPFLLGQSTAVMASLRQLSHVITHLDQFKRPRKTIHYIDLRVPPKIIVGYE